MSTNLHIASMQTAKIQYILLDGSYKSKYCTEGKRNEWDYTIAKCKQYIPNFEENEYHLLTTNFGMLEDIGLGKFREKNKGDLKLKEDYLHYCNQKLVEYCEPTDRDSLKAMMIKANEGSASNYIQDVKKHVEAIFRKKLTQKFLRRQAIVCTREMRYHPIAQMIPREVKKWRKHLQEPSFYDRIISDLVYDTVLRYQYINLSEIRDEDVCLPRDLYIQIYHNLIRTVLDLHQRGYNLSGLSLFAAIEQFIRLLQNPRPPKSWILRPWDDLHDTELIHFAYLGYFTNGQRSPVTVLTSEKQETIKERLRVQKESLQELEEKGFPVMRIPGYIINFDPHDELKSHFLDLNNF